MKRITSVLLILLAVSCSVEVKDKEEIRRLARENYVDEFYPISWLINLYRRANYSSPENYDELLPFVKSAGEHEPFLSEVESFDDRLGGYSMLDLLTRMKVDYASFGDSVFFYVPDRQAGSCIIGTQFYLLEHPEKYDKLDYDYLFSCSAYDEKGSYLFSDRFDYGHFNHLIDSISSRYDCIISSVDSRIDLFTGNPRAEHSPYWSIVSVSSAGASLFFLSRIKSSDSLYVCNHPCPAPLPIFCKDYLDDLQRVFRAVFDENPAADRLVTGINWYWRKEDDYFFSSVSGVTSSAS